MLFEKATATKETRADSGTLWERATTTDVALAIEGKAACSAMPPMLSTIVQTVCALSFEKEPANLVKTADSVMIKGLQQKYVAHFSVVTAVAATLATSGTSKMYAEIISEVTAIAAIVVLTRTITIAVSALPTYSLPLQQTLPLRCLLGPAMIL